MNDFLKACAIAFAIGFSTVVLVNYMHRLQEPANSYQGAPVALSTTGGMRCSPFCGHQH